MKKSILLVLIVVAILATTMTSSAEIIKCPVWGNDHEVESSWTVTYWYNKDCTCCTPPNQYPFIPAHRARQMEYRYRYRCHCGSEWTGGSVMKYEWQCDYLGFHGHR